MINKLITAVYEHGQIHPLEPLNIHEKQKLKILILPDSLPDRSEQIVQLLTKIGLLTLPQGFSTIKPMTEQERSRLAKVLAQAASKPLSKMIIEEREQC